MKLVISEKNMEKLETVLNCAQKGCRARTIDSEGLIETAKETTEHLLCVGVVKSELKTIQFTINCSSKLPNSYNYPAEATWVRCGFNSKGEPVLLSVVRGPNARPATKVEIHGLEKFKEAIIQRISRVVA